MRLLVYFFLTLHSLQGFAAESSFRDILNQLVSRDTSIPRQEARVDSADSRLLSERLSFLPSIRSGYGTTDSSTSFDRTNRLFLAAELNLFKGGTDLSRLSAQASQLNSDRALQADLILKAEYNSAELIFTYLEALNRRRIFNELMKIKQESLDVIKLRSSRGLVPVPEVLKAEIDWQNARAQFLAAETELERRKNFLLEALGHLNIQSDWPMNDDLLKIELKNLENFKTSLSDRPDLKFRQSDIDRDRYRLQASKRDFLPKLDLSYTWQRQGREDFEQNERVMMLNLTFPLFDGWKTVAAYKDEVANVTASTYQYIEAERIARAEFESTQKNLKTLIQTARERDRTLELSRRLFEDNFKRYEEGRVTVNDLQLDQNRLLDTELLANRGWLDAHLGVVSYCHAKGSRLFSCLSDFGVQPE